MNDPIKVDITMPASARYHSEYWQAQEEIYKALQTIAHDYKIPVIFYEHNKYNEEE